MRFASLFALLSLIFVTGFAGESRADYALWRDPGTGVTLTYPDTWMRVNNHQPDDLLTIRAPSGRGDATCRVRAREDGRHTIYPRFFDSDVQKTDYSRNFWDTYWDASYENLKVLRFFDETGLGRAHGSFMSVSYEVSAPGKVIMPRKAMAFVSFAYNQVYVLECSSHADAFAQWEDLFLSIAGSVDTPKIRHEFKRGYRISAIGGSHGLVFSAPENKFDIIY